ncbi:MAG: hypothetical protein ABIV13_05460 [Fimbriimonadales bacterium]
MKCSEFIEGISELAFGKNAPGASSHVAVCTDCAALLLDLKRMAAGFALGNTDAPAIAVKRAASIPLPNKIPRLGLVRRSLAAAGARRSAAETFQCVFEGGGLQVRTMYTKSGKKWEVMATVAPPVDAIEVGGKLVKPVDGKFEFEAKSLDATDFRITVAGKPVAVPPGSDKLSDD